MEGFTMDFGGFQFGSIKIDGVSFKHDVVIDRGKIRKRRKKPSKKFREEFGHSPGIGRGGDALEVPTPHSRHGKIWIASGDGRGETRGSAPRN